jgi:hypothetical protein
MRKKSLRKSHKVFLKMSKIIKTRTADQCRSHHQKVIKYHKTLESILQSYSVFLRNNDFSAASPNGSKMTKQATAE